MSLQKKIAYRLSLEWKLLVLAFFKQFKNFKIENSLIISGDPRGGTTWLNELIGKIPRTATIWEPLNIPEVPEFKKLGFGLRQFIPENEPWAEAEKQFKILFAKGILNEFTSQFISVSNYRNADRLIFKFCRANALLPWLVSRFDFKYKPILLVRHPISVVASQLQQGGWDYKFESFVIPDCPYNDSYLEHESYLKTLKSKEEALVAQWCISNLPTLRHPNNNNEWICIYYENLLIHTQAELNRIEKSWGFSFPKESHIASIEASKTSVNFKSDKMNQLAKWKTYFSADQIDKMLSVMEYFKCEFYNSEIMPILNHTNNQK